MAGIEIEMLEQRQPGGQDEKQVENPPEVMWENPQTEMRTLVPGFITYKMNPLDVTLFGGFMQFNPIVFFTSVICIWTFVIWCATDEVGAKKETDRWNEWIIANFTWFYIGSVGFFGVYDVYLCFSKYGDVILGPDDQPPKYSYASWFAMLFSAGVGIGLFFYGVTEPVCHYASTCWGGYTYPRRWAKLPRYERAIMAMNVTWFHWGLAPSACYCIVGLPLAFLVHRKGMPCTMRTIFYPMMGDTVWGPVGDLIDIFAIMGTMFGISTSLGLGVFQMAASLNRLNEDIKDDKDTHVVIIWTVTAFAAVSVMTGLDYGIRRISEGTFTLGIFMLSMLLMMGNTWFLLSLAVETMGNHVWYLIDLELHTDAFQQLDAIIPDSYYSWGSGESVYMTNWTVFYWGWWISWAPFVGVFIAQISKGRTVREFILGNMFVPTILTSAWFIITGGLGLEMEMRAEALGIGGNQHLRFPNLNTATLETKTFMAASCVSTNSSDITTMVECNKLDNAVGCGSAGINNCIWGYVENAVYVNNTVVINKTEAVVTTSVYNPYDYEFAYNVPICPYNGALEPTGLPEADNPERLTKRLSCEPVTSMLFDVIEYYGEDGMYKFIRIVALVALVFYFVTSSDSGSHVIDMMCSNGVEDPPLCQRIFWAVSEGGVAHVLITAGEPNAALKSLRAASIAAGLPFCGIMLAMCYCTQKMFAQWEVEHPAGVPKRVTIDDVERGPCHAWQNPILTVWHDVVIPFASCGVELCGFFPFGERKRGVIDVLKAIFIPFLVQVEVNERAGIQRGFASYFAGGSFICWILFEILEVAERHMSFVGWNFYLLFVCCMVAERMAFRDHYRLNGSPAEDGFILCFCYPCAVLQEMSEQDSSLELRASGKTETKPAVEPKGSPTDANLISAE